MRSKIHYKRRGATALLAILFTLLMIYVSSASAIRSSAKIQMPESQQRIQAQVNAESVEITSNGTGIRAANTSIVRMSNLDIFNNTTGIVRTETAALASFSNNKIANNGTQDAPTA